MDSLANQYVTIRADGDTKIDTTSVRTPTYLEDATGDSDGFLKVQVDGEDGTRLDVAGNLKEITTLTPKSSVNVDKGSVMSLTVDEAAAGSTVSVFRRIRGQAESGRGHACFRHGRRTGAQCQRGR